TVMSNFDDSTVTYTVVSSPFVGLSDIESPGVDGPPVMPEDPYAYVVAAFQAPSSPDYVPGYVPESDPEEDPEEGDDEDPEEDPADYTADGGDDGDDEDESSDDDDDVDIEEDEEEEHLALAESTAVAFLTVEHAPSVEETEPFKTAESAATPPPNDDGDDEDESSDDDDDVDIEEDEEEEHLALAESTAVAFLTVEHAPSVKETEPFETAESAATPPPNHAYWVTTRIS
ncbi:hypothetical protein Tco_0135394, partial [Tanacetum coccineum]